LLMLAVMKGITYREGEKASIAGRDEGVSMQGRTRQALREVMKGVTAGKEKREALLAVMKSVTHRCVYVCVCVEKVSAGLSLGTAISQPTLNQR